MCIRDSSNAVAFLTGRRVGCTAREVIRESNQSRFLATRPIRYCKQPYMGPFCHDTRLVVGYEQFLSLATNFFSTETGQHVAGLLDACINATENSFTTQAMVSCATVESLVDTYKHMVRSDESPPERKQFLNRVRKKVEELLVSLEVDAQDRNRIGGLFGMLHSTSTSAILRELCDRNWAEISANEVKAWSDLRNQVMHGNLVLENAKPEKVQTEVARLQLVTNLINKIVLQVIEYSGPFFDYSTWSISEFKSKDVIESAFRNGE